MFEFGFHDIRALAIKILLVVGFFGSSRTLMGADYISRFWDEGDGLPLNAISDVAQTPDGYVWISTLFNGLYRYDGVRFVGFTGDTTRALSRQSLRKLFVDSQGALWILSYEGLVRYQDGTFKLEQYRGCHADTLIYSDARRVDFATLDNQILRGTLQTNGDYQWKTFFISGLGKAMDLCADQTGTIWYRLPNGELGRILKDQCATVDPGFAGRPVTALAASPGGEIWLAVGGQLARWDGRRFEDQTPTNGAPLLKINQLLFSANGDLWVGGNSQLCRWQNRRWVATAGPRKGQSPTDFKFIRGDAQGGLWLALASGLAHLQSNGDWDRLTELSRQPSSLIHCLFTDREDNLWIAYEHGGLALVRPRFFQVVGRPEGLQDPIVSSVCEDAAGTLWLGTVNGILGRWQSGQCTNLFLPEKDRRSLYLIISPGQDGRIWVSAVTKGLFVWTGQEFQSVLSPSELIPDVRIMLATHDGRLWLAGKRTLLCYAEGTVTKVFDAPLDFNGPASLAEGVDGDLWMGTFGGELVHFVGTNTIVCSPQDNVPANRFCALAVESDGAVWVGTLGSGLLRYSAGVFHRFTQSDGLPSDQIFQVISDQLGYLWLGTGAGLVRVNPADLNRCANAQIKTVPYRSFGRSDGLRSTVCAVEFQPLCWLGKYGRLWFGMANGAAGVRPESITTKLVSPQVLIEKVLVDGTVQPPPPQAEQKSPLKIAPGRHELEIQYTAPSFFAPEDMRFRYQLAGWESAWQPGDSHRSVIYRYLPPGHYTFQVQVCGSDGVWNESLAVLPIVMLPHFWETFWFIPVASVGLMLGAGGLMALVLRARHRQRLAGLKLQRDLERERTRVAQDLHDDLGAGLAQIGLIGALAQRASVPPGQIQEHLKKITGTAREMVTALDEIVWAINPKHDNAASLTSYFCDYAQEFLRPAMMTCRLEVSPNLPELTLNSHQRHVFFLAFREALTNVLRHAHASEVRITVSADENDFVVMVVDNGRGLPVDLNRAGADGTGNMVARLAQLGGRCEIQNASGGGASVRFVLPLRSRTTR